MKDSYTWLYALLLLVMVTSCNSKNKTSIVAVTDEVDQLVDKASDRSKKADDRNQFLMEAFRLELMKDSISATRLSQIAYTFLKWDSITLFKNANAKAREVARKSNDTFALADTHWNDANFYYKRNHYDSAYFHYNEGRKGFEKVGKIYYTGKMLINMAYIRGRLRDYVGSETLTIQAIRRFDQEEKHKSLYAAYNHLAILSKEVQEYDKSLFYHSKATSYLEKIKENTYLEIGSLNNIGVVHQQKGDFMNAKISFKNALDKADLKANDISLYAKVLDNLAYTRFLDGESENVQSELLNAYKLRDSIGNDAGLIISSLHLGEYLFYNGKVQEAVAFGVKAKNIANKINNNRDYLNALEFLKKADTKNAFLYAERYIAFNDSLLQTERKVQNSLTRIELETDQYKEESARSSEQKMWILAISSTILFILILGFIIRIQKSKNKLLSFEIAQQKANEEIFMLTLDQQKKMEEVKVMERNRISEELHDGVLGQLFGTRMGLGFLKFSGEDAALPKYYKYVDELQGIEKEIRSISHDLKSSDVNGLSNLETLVTNLLDQKSELADFNYDVRIERAIDWEAISETAQLQLYRIIQESIQNVIKHSQAQNVYLDIRTKSETLLLTIKDDGVGFNPLSAKAGIGLKNIKSRAKKIRANVEIVSDSTSGTTLKLTLKIKDLKNEDSNS